MGRRVSLGPRISEVEGATSYGISKAVTETCGPVSHPDNS